MNFKRKVAVLVIILNWKRTDLFVFMKNCSENCSAARIAIETRALLRYFCHFPKVFITFYITLSRVWREQTKRFSCGLDIYRIWLEAEFPDLLIRLRVNFQSKFRFENAKRSNRSTEVKEKFEFQSLKFRIPKCSEIFSSKNLNERIFTRILTLNSLWTSSLIRVWSALSTLTAIETQRIGQCKRFSLNGSICGQPL